LDYSDNPSGNVAETISMKYSGRMRGKGLTGEYLALTVYCIAIASVTADRKSREKLFVSAITKKDLDNLPQSFGRP